LVQKIMITHHKSTIYYPQGNSRAKSTNKILKQILTKLVNANQNDWGVMLPTALWAYWIAYKASTQHTPYELIYGLMPLLPIEFINPTTKQLRKRMGFTWMRY
jgi:hypothetical protein